MEFMGHHGTCLLYSGARDMALLKCYNEEANSAYKCSCSGIYDVKLRKLSACGRRANKAYQHRVATTEAARTKPVGSPVDVCSLFNCMRLRKVATIRYFIKPWRDHISQREFENYASWIAAFCLLHQNLHNR